MREKELRLALVCYGGVSLAVYMHGIAKEIWRMLRASRNYHDGGAAQSGSQGVYRQIFEDIETQTGIKLRVLNDILAGSSAGGINAIFLGQAIVSGQSLEPLTDLWLNTADVDSLVDPDARALSRFSKPWAVPIAWAALRRSRTLQQTVGADAREEVADKLSRFVRARWFEPPFGGQVFCGLLYDAFEAMQESAAGPILLPAGQPLDLFVTATDFDGHPRRLALNSPPIVLEREHRVTISFSNRQNQSNSLGELPDLVMAARATASFPGAFPPFMVSEMDSFLEKKDVLWPGRTSFLKRVLPSSYQGREDEAVLVDGSILSNAPFAQAIDALRNRPARREVDRRFVYIDPVPDSQNFHFGPTERKGGSQPPGFFATILGSVTNIPRQQPIGENLKAIQGRSARISRMRAVASSMRKDVDEQVNSMFGSTLLLMRPTAKRLGMWRQKAYEKAVRASGFSYAAYGHFRLTFIVDDLAKMAQRVIADEGGEPALDNMREALWTELRVSGLASTKSKSGRGLNQDLLSFFRAHDIRYRIRRLRFLARRLAEDVEPRDDVSEAVASKLHDAIFDGLALYLERENSRFLEHEGLGKAARELEEDAAAFLNQLSAHQLLEELDKKVDALLCPALLGLNEEARRIMLLTFLGFPLFDIATLPLLEGEELFEFDPIKVDRISPTDANMIREGGARAMLKGIEFNNFGAFFSRAYRENDYLWGRLNGAERLVDIILSTLPEAQRPNEPQIRAYKCAAFRAILDEEQPRLTRISDLFAEIRSEISICEGKNRA